MDIPDLTEAEIRAGFVRRDPDTLDPLRKGVQTQAEARAWWIANGRRWMARAFAKEPPEPTGWTWTESLGWTRRNPNLKATGAELPESRQEAPRRKGRAR